MLFEIYFNVIDLFIDFYYVLLPNTLLILTPIVGLFVYFTKFIDIIYFQIQNIFLLKLISFNILNIAIKFIILIALLIFVRGGIPRYRYDFLTKVG